MQITFDVDGTGWVSNLRAMAVCFYILKTKCPNGGELVVKSSPSGRGFHYILTGARLSRREIAKYRLVGGDDEKRIRFDRLREAQGYPTQVLFQKKRTIKL